MTAHGARDRRGVRELEFKLSYETSVASWVRTLTVAAHGTRDQRPPWRRWLRLTLASLAACRHTYSAARDQLVRRLGSRVSTSASGGAAGYGRHASSPAPIHVPVTSRSRPGHVPVTSRSRPDSERAQGGGRRVPAVLAVAARFCRGPRQALDSQERSCSLLPRTATRPARPPGAALPAVAADRPETPPRQTDQKHRRDRDSAAAGFCRPRRGGEASGVCVCGWVGVCVGWGVAGLGFNSRPRTPPPPVHTHSVAPLPTRQRRRRSAVCVLHVSACVGGWVGASARALECVRWMCRGAGGRK